jgi:hypothetical protein
MDGNLARQRLVVNDLKTQLSQLDPNQQQADEAAKQAQQKQESTCDTIADVGRVVGIVVTIVGAALLALATGGKANNQTPLDGSYGPINPNDPNIPDPTRRPGELLGQPHSSTHFTRYYRQEEKRLRTKQYEKELLVTQGNSPILLE